MDDQSLAARAPLPSTRWLVGVVATFAIGFLVLPVLGRFAPGDLPTFALVGVAGFAGVIVQPGWSGFVGSGAGLAAYVTVIAAMAGFSGLHYLALAFMLPAVAAGAACGTIVHRVRTIGVGNALLDRRVWAAAGGAVVVSAALIWIYVGLVTSGSPP